MNYRGKISFTFRTIGEETVYAHICKMQFGVWIYGNGVSIDAEYRLHIMFTM